MVRPTMSVKSIPGDTGQWGKSPAMVNNHCDEITRIPEVQCKEPDYRQNKKADDHGNTKKLNDPDLSNLPNLSGENGDIGSFEILHTNGKSEAILASENAEDYEQSLKAPDGGYGWFVVLGSFLVHVLIGGLGRSDGIFFILFTDRFHESATLTAWPLALSGLLRLGLGPIASAICQRWSVRACAMVGGLGLGLVQVFSAYSPNFAVLFLSNGLLQGVARGLLYGPSLILVNMYFDNRRSLATGLAASGIGVGTLVLVPLIQVVFDAYSFTGGFLVLGGVCFNGVLVAMLLRPLSMHYRFIGKKGVRVEQPDPSESVMLSELSDGLDATSLRSVHLRSTLSVNRAVESEQEESNGLMSNNLTGYSSKQAHLQFSTLLDDTLLDMKPYKKPFWKSTLDILFPIEENQCKAEDGKKEKTKVFHFELLREPAFSSFCLGIGLFTATFKSTFAFMPALAKASGLTSTEAVAILSISGGVDALGRILAGFLLDKPFLSKRRLLIYCSIQFLLAAVCASMPFAGASFPKLCVASSLFGMMTGILASQKSVVCVDLLDAERMPSAFGILLLFQAIGVGVGPLLSGLCRDAFGRFHEAFYLGAGLMALSACLTVYSNVVHTLNKRRNR